MRIRQQHNGQQNHGAVSRRAGQKHRDAGAYASLPLRQPVSGPSCRGLASGMAVMLGTIPRFAGLGPQAAASRPLVLVLLAAIAAGLLAFPAQAQSCKAKVFGPDPWFSEGFWQTTDPAGVQACLDEGRKATEYTGDGFMPIFLAVGVSTDPRVVEVLIDNGAPLDVGDIEHNTTPLHVAASFARIPDMTETLLRRGAYVDPQDVCGNTPLLYAAQKGIVATAEILVGHGANVDVVNCRGETAMHIAAGHSDPAFIELMLGQGARTDLQDSSGNTAFHLSIEKQRSPELVERFLAAGAGVEARNKDGDTPFHVAIRSLDDPGTVRRLLEAGADVGARNAKGETPLHHAVGYQSDPGTLKYLIDKGASLNTRDKGGNTPLHWAARSENPAVLEFLLAAGVDHDIKNLEGKTAYELIRQGSPLHGSDVFWRLHDLHHE